MFNFETKEEFENAVKELFSSVIEEKLKGLQPAPATPPAEGAEKTVSPEIQGVLDQLKALNETVTGLTEKTEKIGNQFATQPAGNETEDPPNNAEATKKKSVFAGLLTAKE